MKLLIVLFLVVANFSLVCFSDRVGLSYLQPCKRTGCFNERCARVTVFNRRCPPMPEPRDLCKRFATCGPSSNFGQCRWTETEEFKNCVKKNYK